MKWEWNFDSGLTVPTDQYLPVISTVLKAAAMKLNIRISSDCSLHVCLFVGSDCKPPEGKKVSYTWGSCTVIGWKGIKDTVHPL